MGWLNFEDGYVKSGVGYRQHIAYVVKQRLFCYNLHPHPTPVRCHAQTTAGAWL